jgi:hypothetical protein
VTTTGLALCHVPDRPWWPLAVRQSSKAELLCVGND